MIFITLLSIEILCVVSRQYFFLLWFLFQIWTSVMSSCLPTHHHLYLVHPDVLSNTRWTKIVLNRVSAIFP